MNINKIGHTIKKESPTILTGLGVAGLFTTVGLAIRATPSAMRAIYGREEREKMTFYDIVNDVYLEPPFVDKVKLAWKFYIPTALSGGLTIACIIGANRISLRRNAALISLYSISEAALLQYQDKVIELVGKNKASKIDESLVQDELDRNPVKSNEVIFTGNGDHLFYDSLSGRYFYTDIETVRKLINQFNKELLGEMYLILNDFYSLLGLEETDLGRNMGWDPNVGLLEVRFTTKVATNGAPCMVMEYPLQPKYL